MRNEEIEINGDRFRLPIRDRMRKTVTLMMPKKYKVLDNGHVLPAQ